MYVYIVFRPFSSTSKQSQDETFRKIWDGTCLEAVRSPSRRYSKWDRKSSLSRSLALSLSLSLAKTTNRMGICAQDRLHRMYVHRPDDGGYKNVAASWSSWRSRRWDLYVLHWRKLFMKWAWRGEEASKTISRRHGLMRTETVQTGVELERGDWLRKGAYTSGSQLVWKCR